MKICRLQIDKQNRITLPKSFLDANNISSGQWGFMTVIVGKHRSVKLTFESRTERKSREEYLEIDSKP
jgi:hypothetical protein|tara:strand:+ start:4832 stop:5035 length:204 start_codon:yes stop_codon:yes gene_type:complete